MAFILYVIRIEGYVKYAAWRHANGNNMLKKMYKDHDNWYSSLLFLSSSQNYEKSFLIKHRSMHLPYIYNLSWN